MKNRRQKAILDMVETKKVRTQDDIAAELKNLGIEVTQATISRDIKQLRLLKVIDAEGRQRYALRKDAAEEMTERQMRIFSDTVLSIEYAQNMVVIKTIAGSASAAAEALDTLQCQEVLGSIAGDNTIFLVTRDEASSREVKDRLSGYLHR